MRIIRWKAMTRHEVAIWDSKKCVKSYVENMKELATKFNVSNIGMVNIVETYWKQ